ncbi:amidohydrolase [Micrococcus luteus]|uniref:amidohydrolase n=1 Tax=Micrococcus luteus TaxID=1270 RepID=UPI002A4BFD96|nr:amidohydrolase [Micrococcus luteus]
MQLDLILEHARIHTMTADRPSAGRVGVWQGRVVGVDEELEGCTARERVDLGGRTVLPGFNDAHAHSVWFGQTLLEVDLSGATTLDDVLEAVRCDAERRAPGEWVKCSGYSPLSLTTRTPRREDLDAAAGGRPVLLRHNSGHAFTVNTAVLEQAGIGVAPGHQPEGGRIVTDESGKATGLLEETAMALVQELILPESRAEIAQCLAAATEAYAAEGLTSVTDAGTAGGWIGHSPQELAAYQDARDAGRLRTRLQAMVTSDVLHDVGGHADDPAALTLDAGLRSGLGDEWFELGPVKFFTDGSLLGATAAMTDPYCSHGAETGYLQMDAPTMAARIRGAARAGWALALHAIGDAALDFALETIEQARAEAGPGPMPDRIEHGGVVRPDQVARMAALGVALVPQPHFLASFGDGMAGLLGPERTALSYPARRLLDAGMMLPGSSDRPVAPGAPLAVVQSFVRRLTQSGEVYGPDERIGVEEALRAYTVGSAAATGWAGRKGQVAAGQLADLVVLEEDPLRVEPDDLADIPISSTWVGGAITYGEER